MRFLKFTPVILAAIQFSGTFAIPFVQPFSNEHLVRDVAAREASANQIASNAIENLMSKDLYLDKRFLGGSFGLGERNLFNVSLLFKLARLLGIGLDVSLLKRDLSFGSEDLVNFDLLLKLTQILEFYSSLKGERDGSESLDVSNLARLFEILDRTDDVDAAKNDASVQSLVDNLITYDTIPAEILINLGNLLGYNFGVYFNPLNQHNLITVNNTFFLQDLITGSRFDVQYILSLGNILGLFESPITTVGNLFGNLTNIAAGTGNFITSLPPLSLTADAFDVLADVIVGKLHNTIPNIISNQISSLTSGYSNLSEQLNEFISNQLSEISANVGQLTDDIRDIVTNLIEELLSNPLFNSLSIDIDNNSGLIRTTSNVILRTRTVTITNTVPTRSSTLFVGATINASPLPTTPTQGIDPELLQALYGLFNSALNLPRNNVSILKHLNQAIFVIEEKLDNFSANHNIHDVYQQLNTMRSSIHTIDYAVDKHMKHSLSFDHLLKTYNKNINSNNIYLYDSSKLKSLYLDSLNRALILNSRYTFKSSRYHSRPRGNALNPSQGNYYSTSKKETQKKGYYFNIVGTQGDDAQYNFGQKNPIIENLKKHYKILKAGNNYKRIYVRSADAVNNLNISQRDPTTEDPKEAYKKEKQAIKDDKEAIKQREKNLKEQRKQYLKDQRNNKGKRDEGIEIRDSELDLDDCESTEEDPKEAYKKEKQAIKDDKEAVKQREKNLKEQRKQYAKDQRNNKGKRDEGIEIRDSELDLDERESTDEDPKEAYKKEKQAIKDDKEAIKQREKNLKEQRKQYVKDQKSSKGKKRNI